MTKERNKKTLDDKIIEWVSAHLVCSFLILIAVVLVVLLSVFVITAFVYNDRTVLDPNEIGDAIGGMTAPIIGLFSAFLVYIAFREQKKANDKLQRQNILNELDLLETKLKNNLKNLTLISAQGTDDKFIYGKNSIYTFFNTYFKDSMLKYNENNFNKSFIINNYYYLANKYANDLNLYFESILQNVKAIKKSVIDKDIKIHYIKNIEKNHLKNFEVEYNNELINFFELCNKYNFLGKHVTKENKSILINMQECLEKYNDIIKLTHLQIFKLNNSQI